MWEVHDKTIDPFEGGFSAYVLQRVERDRLADLAEQKRQNQLRRELAWLSRGARARARRSRSSTWRRLGRSSPTSLRFAIPSSSSAWPWRAWESRWSTSSARAFASGGRRCSTTCRGSSDPAIASASSGRTAPQDDASQAGAGRAGSHERKGEDRRDRAFRGFVPAPRRAGEARRRSRAPGGRALHAPHHARRQGDDAGAAARAARVHQRRPERAGVRSVGRAEAPAGAHAHPARRAQRARARRARQRSGHRHAGRCGGLARRVAGDVASGHARPLSHGTRDRRSVRRHRRQASPSAAGDRRVPRAHGGARGRRRLGGRRAVRRARAGMLPA